MKMLLVLKEHPHGELKMFICCFSGGSLSFVGFDKVFVNRTEHLHVLLQWLRFGF